MRRHNPVRAVLPTFRAGCGDLHHKGEQNRVEKRPRGFSGPFTRRQAAANQPPTDSHLYPEFTPMADATDDRLRLLIERIERLEEEKKGIAEDIRDVYSEAKAVGYDAKIMRQIVRLRKMKPDDRSEQEMILDTYKAALGMM